jgi:2-succinyl-6-hydroxy-2,4-cyclohexadiene-1-carboxylate synthase
VAGVIVQMKLHHRAFGEKSSRHLVFLHGFLGCGEDWLPIAQHLEPGYYSTLVDLPGHGESEVPERGDYSVDDVVEAVAGIISDLRQPVLIGYSMGGRVALATAVRYQKNLGGLVLEGAAPGLQTENERIERVELDDSRAEELLRMGTREFVSKWYQAELFSSLQDNPEKLATLLALRSIGDAENLASTLRNLSVGRQESLWDSLDDLTLPVLLIAGELDSKFVATNNMMAERMRNVEAAVIADAGHNTHFEQPESYLRCLVDYLEELGEGTA